jgi:hypothetical protein
MASIGLDPYFIEATKHVASKGLYRLYIQYAYLPQFFSMYLGEAGPYIDAVCHSMTFAGMNFQATDDMELKGYTFLKDTVDPYVAAFLRSGKQEIKAQSILPDRTAFYTHIGFDNPATFLKELEKALSNDPSPSLYAAYKSNYKQIESTLDISLADDFLSWMSGEFAITEVHGDTIRKKANWNAREKRFEPIESLRNFVAKILPYKKLSLLLRKILQPFKNR